MTDPKRTYAMGWLPDYPDIRDYTEQREEIRMILGARRPSKARSFPASTDLRE